MTMAIWIPTSLLILSAALDLRFAKFPNWLFLASAGLGVLWLTLHHSLADLASLLTYSLLFFVVLIPFFYFKIFGAGDIKLLTSLSLFVSVPTAATVLVYSLFWGLLIGLLKIGLSGEIVTFVQSLLLRNPQVRSHKIPFAVAILIGWCTFLVAGDIL